MNNNSQPFVTTQVLKVNTVETAIVEEPVVVEKALTVYLNDEEFVTIVCSPGYERELVIGFLRSEGVIARPEDIEDITLDNFEGIVWVSTTTGTLGEKLFLKRYLTSCCGKGRSSFYFANDARLVNNIESSLQLTSEQVFSYLKLLDDKSDLFHLTGGVHGGGLVSEGKLEFFAYDIGRHNVLDKLYGQAFDTGVDLSCRVLVFSGRISSEILVKTAKMGCPVLIGVSAPTDLALQMAEEVGVTVIGFARGSKMNVYTHKERIISPVL